MFRAKVLVISAMLAATAATAAPKGPVEVEDLYFGEALYCAYQADWFGAITRLDTELAQHYGLDQPELDPLYRHVGQAEFDVGDFELAYRMHRRAGRAITAVIEGDVDDVVRNGARYRLARIYFQKNQPERALETLDTVDGAVDAELEGELALLRAQALMAAGRYEEATPILRELVAAGRFEGFAGYNLGVSQLKSGDEEQGLKALEAAGTLQGDDRPVAAIRDKANLVLGEKILEGADADGAALDAAIAVFERVRLDGPFSNRALLGLGWAEAMRGRYKRALVPWSILGAREMTDVAVQEALLAVPYAYGKLGVYSKAALLYDSSLAAIDGEIEKLDSSIESIGEGRFLAALTRDEMSRDADWVVRLRELPGSPETYYLLELMASHDFQESLKNYLDLAELRRKLQRWQTDLDAYEEIISIRRDYYEPLLPGIDDRFRRLDSKMRLRLEQKERIAERLRVMLVNPAPEYLATAEEQRTLALLGRLEAAVAGDGSGFDEARIKRLRGALGWEIATGYDERLTDAYEHLAELDADVTRLKAQYDSFVRVRQAATQSYEGYGETIEGLRTRISDAFERVDKLLERQGGLIEAMAVRELTARRDRLEGFQAKARFALADSYDRATRGEDDQAREVVKGGAQ